MNSREIKAMMAELAPVIREFTEAAVARAMNRIEAVEKRLAEAPAQKDAVSVTSAVIDRNGSLILTMSDGSTKDIGQVVGKDGEPGVDGLGFDDMTEELADDGRTIVRRYQRGDQVKEFRHTMAVVLDRGVYKAGSTYQAGDGVTYGGSFWIAQEETAEKPDSGKGWRLAVKRGRDGKNALEAPARLKEPIRVGVPAKAD
ncbi:hypothetical protein [Chelativorans sp. J32]|uniref:hypothetical protein n=1 Tax=Chelativorans sp. J32 TaxID=935840 RepID=UPI0004ADC9E4|nr:hypothetical protein [Chelativorans sp. J32]